MQAVTMSQTLNTFQQPIGRPMPDWQPCARPPGTPLRGRFCRLERLNVARHAADLYLAYSQAEDGRDWTYLFTGPFTDEASYFAHAQHASISEDPLHYAVIDLASGKAVGTLALMRIDPANGVIDVGHVTFSPRLKRTPLSTEAQYLLMKHLFEDLGYRRYEWKCDSLNAPSRKAAARLGFRFEGIFRQALIYRNRSRDTAWFSIIDGEWPARRVAFEHWLALDNFDAEGIQRSALPGVSAEAG